MILLRVTDNARVYREEVRREYGFVHFIEQGRRRQRTFGPRRGSLTEQMFDRWAEGARRVGTSRSLARGRAA